MLKSSKGITLTSLVIYIIVLMIVIALFSNFSGYFFKNVNQITIKEIGDEQFTRFLAYLTKDINLDEINFVKTGTYNNVNYIILKFEDNIEHQYLYANKAIYYIDKNRNKTINLCNNVSSCNFMYDDTTKALTVNIIINNINYTKLLIVNNN